MFPHWKTGSGSKLLFNNRIWNSWTFRMRLKIWPSNFMAFPTPIKRIWIQAVLFLYRIRNSWTFRMRMRIWSNKFAAFSTQTVLSFSPQDQETLSQVCCCGCWRNFDLCEYDAFKKIYSLNPPFFTSPHGLSKNQWQLVLNHVRHLPMRDQKIWGFYKVCLRQGVIDRVKRYINKD